MCQHASRDTCNTHQCPQPCTGAAPQDVPSWRRWSESDIEADEDADVDRKLQVGEQVLELASKLLTGSYARKQAAAGRKCGIEVGGGGASCTAGCCLTCKHWQTIKRQVKDMEAHTPRCTPARRGVACSAGCGSQQWRTGSCPWRRTHVCQRPPPHDPRCHERPGPHAGHRSHRCRCRMGAAHWPGPPRGCRLCASGGDGRGSVAGGAPAVARPCYWVAG